MACPFGLLLNHSQLPSIVTAALSLTFNMATDETITRNESTTSTAVATAEIFPEASEEFLQISEIIDNYFASAHQHGPPDLQKTIKSCHESFSKCISYFHFCHKTWTSNSSTALERSYNQRLGSLRLLTKHLLQLTRGYKTESLPLKQLQDDTESQAKLRRKRYESYLAELRMLERTVKNVHADVERYLKFLRNLYLEFLLKDPQDFGDMHDAMELNSQIVVQWIELVLKNRMTFHFKVLKDYEDAFTTAGGGEITDRIRFLMVDLDSKAQRATEEYVSAIKKLLGKFHESVGQLADSLDRNVDYSRHLTMKKLTPVMNAVYQKTKAKLEQGIGTVVGRNVESEDRLKELRQNLRAAGEPAMVKLGNVNYDDDDSSMNSEPMSTMSRKFDIQKQFDLTKPSIIGHSFKTFLQQCTKLFDSKLKTIKTERNKSKESIHSSAQKTQDSLEDWLTRLYKKSRGDLEDNRKRASTFVKYQAEQRRRGGNPVDPRALKRYRLELSNRAKVHAGHLKKFCGILVDFFERTIDEFQALSKKNSQIDPSSYSCVCGHKALACNVIFSTFQAQLRVNAEHCLVKLMNLAEGLGMKDQLGRAAIEFSVGLWWVDHEFFKRVVLCAEDSLTVLKNFGLVGKPSPFGAQDVVKADIQETLEVVSLLFAAFLKSQSIPTSEERKEVRLKDPSSSTIGSEDDWESKVTVAADGTTENNNKGKEVESSQVAGKDEGSVSNLRNIIQAYGRKASDDSKMLGRPN